MTRRPSATPWRRAAAAVALALGVAAIAAGSPAAVAAPVQAGPDVGLVSQTPTVDAGATYVAMVTAEGARAGDELRVVVHDRVRSRSELDRTFGGEGLRGALSSTTQPYAALETEPGGPLRVVLDLAPGAPLGDAVRTAGVYPVSIDLLDADGDRRAGLVTHLVLRPPPSPAAPPLDVAVLLRVGAAPAPTDEPPLTARRLGVAQALVDAALAAADLPVTLAPTPDTLAQLLAGGTPEETGLLDGLRTLAATAPTLAQPYTGTSPDALAEAGLRSELDRHLQLGAAVQSDLLGVAPTQTTWLAGGDLGAEGLELLDSLGVRRVVVAPDQVELAAEGVLTPAGPFEVVPPARRGRSADDDPAALDALATDARLGELLESTRVEPGLLASRLLADLAMLWFERPGLPRAVVLPVDTGVDPEAVRAVLEGLRATALFRPVALDDAFRTAQPLTDRRGDVLRRSLVPGDVPELGDATARRIVELRSLRGSLEAMVGPDAPVLSQLDRHVLRATATGLDGDGRREELDRARGAIDELADAINTPEEAAITLTAREGRVPLTIANETGRTVEVRVRLSSPKLELPGGETFEMTLTGTRSRLDIPVRTLASGSFPFDVEVTSPDGRITLASTTYSVRSTAVSGVGLVLSAGAGLFLIVWWARHWREARRSAKLVNGGARGPAPGGG